MRFTTLIILLSGILAMTACQRETATPTTPNDKPPDTLKSVPPSDTTLALDTASIPKMYVEYIEIFSTPGDVPLGTFSFSYAPHGLATVDTVMNVVSTPFPLINDKGSFGGHYFVFDGYGSPGISATEHYTSTNPYDLYLIYYNYIDGKLTRIDKENPNDPASFKDSTLIKNYKYDAAGRLSEIYSHIKINSFEDNDPALRYYDEKNFTYDAAGNIISETVMDSGNVNQFKTYRYEYSNRASRICTKANRIFFTQCGIFDHTLALDETFFKMEVTRITETETNLATVPAIILPPVVHNYYYQYNPTGWVTQLTDSSTAGGIASGRKYVFTYLGKYF